MSNQTNPGRQRSGTQLVAALAGFCLLVAACGSESADLGESSASIVVDASTTLVGEEEAEGGSERAIVTAAEDASTTTAEDASTTTAAAQATSTIAESDIEPAPVNESGIAGEPLDFGPSAGTPLAIVGVAYDDTLNFRVDPSPDADIFASYAPLSDVIDMSAAGSAWAAPSSVWWMVDIGGSAAWANQAFLGSLGTTTNAFDQVSAELGALEFDSVEDAALAVANLRASDDPVSQIVFAREVLLIDFDGFATVDVVGLGDDSLKGERIQIEVSVVYQEETAAAGPDDVAFVMLTDVQITPICGRGLSNGLCN